MLLAALVCLGALAVAAAARPHSTSPPRGLSFAAEPTNTAVGRSLTDSSGGPVTVEVVDSEGRLVTSPSVTVTVAIGANPGGATLGGTTSATTVNGVAKFTNLTLDQPGNGYTLTASSLRLSGATSTSFDINSRSELCRQNITCQILVTTPNSNFQITANPDPTMPNSGTLSVSPNVGAPLQCTGYTPQDANWWEFVMSSANRSKTIVYTLKTPHLTSTPTATVNDTQFCFGAPSVFTTRSGAPAAAGTLPDGSSGFIGLLPNCPASGPCIVSRQSVPDVSSPTGFDIVVTVNIPEALAGDPWGRA